MSGWSLRCEQKYWLMTWNSCILAMTSSHMLRHSCKSTSRNDQNASMWSPRTSGHSTNSYQEEKKSVVRICWHAEVNIFTMYMEGVNECMCVWWGRGMSTLILPFHETRWIPYNSVQLCTRTCSHTLHTQARHIEKCTDRSGDQWWAGSSLRPNSSHVARTCNQCTSG